MIVVPVIEGQSLNDIAIQEYGSIEYVFQILKDNEDLSINSNVSAGNTIIIDDTIKGEPTVKAFFQEEKRNKKFPVNNSDFEGGSYSGDYDNDYDISN